MWLYSSVCIRKQKRVDGHTVQAIPHQLSSSNGTSLGLGLLLLAQLVTGLLASDIPNCTYIDTMDLTHSLRYENGSYEYEGMLLGPHLTGIYDYKLQCNGERISVPPHMRGCVCLDRVCIRLCCAQDAQQCNTTDIFMNIVQANGSVLSTTLSSSGMLIQYGLTEPCEVKPVESSLANDSQSWQLYETGDLLLHNQRLSRQAYCLQPAQMDQQTYAFILHTFAAPPTMFERIKSYLQLSSVCFLALTIAVYRLLPQLQTACGMCCLCYFASLLVAYAMLNLDSWHIVEDGLPCLLTGYIGYFALMAALLWLAIINLSLWRQFGRKTYGLLSRNRAYYFKLYSLFAWGIAGLLLVIVAIADDLVNSDWSPGVGSYSCWIYTERASAFIYFYGPMLVLLGFNAIMFLVTAANFYTESIKTQKVLSKEAAQLRKRQALIKQDYCIIARFFLTMGISWLLEILSKLFDNEDHKDGSSHMLNLIFNFGDLLNSGLGVIIFIETILKTDVCRMLIKRCAFPNSEKSTKHNSSSTHAENTSKTSNHAASILLSSS